MSKPEAGTAVEKEAPGVEEQGDAPVEKEAPKPEAKQLERRKEDPDGPPPNTPRWNEVYGKWKATERKLEEREKDVEAIREHNRALEERLNRVEATKADRPPEPEPDPAVDPDAYKKWHEMRRLAERTEWEKQRAIDRHETQVEVQKEMHEDYLDMIKIAEREMAKDPELKKKIWGSGNPPREAYKYGEKRAKEMEEKEREAQSRDVAKKQTETEPTGDGGGEREDEPEERLSEDEIRVCRNLFPDMKLEEAKKKYIKQKTAMRR